MNNKLMMLIESLCRRELNDNAECTLAKEILEALGHTEECICEEEIKDFDVEERILNYVEREGNCTVDQIKLVDEEEIPVYKVTVREFDNTWRVPKPDFWWVCPYPMMNMYRSDHQTPTPWLADGQEEEAVIDYIKTFHIGVVHRILAQSDEEIH